MENTDKEDENVSKGLKKFFSNAKYFVKEAKGLLIGIGAIVGIVIAAYTQFSGGVPKTKVDDEIVTEKSEVIVIDRPSNKSKGEPEVIIIEVPTEPSYQQSYQQQEEEEYEEVFNVEEPYLVNEYVDIDEHGDSIVVAVWSNNTETFLYFDEYFPE